MLLHLVRHGETTYNAEGRIQGQSEASLSDLGHRQAKAAAEALAATPIDAIYASPLRRAAQTAQYIADQLGLPILTDRRLMELDAGVFEGHLKSDLAKTYPEQLARWLGGDDDFAIPTGESRRQLADRGCEALHDIAAREHRAVVIVTHGGLLSATLRRLLNMKEPLPPFALQNGSITRLTVNGDAKFSLVAINEVGHLDSVGLTGGGDL